jgi:hypothetical protein
MTKYLLLVPVTAASASLIGSLQYWLLLAPFKRSLQSVPFKDGTIGSRWFPWNAIVARIGPLKNSSRLSHWSPWNLALCPLGIFKGGISISHWFPWNITVPPSVLSRLQQCLSLPWTVKVSPIGPLKAAAVSIFRQPRLQKHLLIGPCTGCGTVSVVQLILRHCRLLVPL